MVKIQIDAEVDDCLADEIRELNNIHGVRTIYSCCGHTIKHSAYISVLEGKDKMIMLGYDQIFPDFPEAYARFIPKSPCKCKEPKEIQQGYIYFSKERIDDELNTFRVGIDNDIRSFTIKEFLTRLGFLQNEGGK